MNPASTRLRSGLLWRWGLFGVLLLAFIIVPFVLFEDTMDTAVQQGLRSERSLAMITLAVVLFLLADIVLPIPSSFVLSTTGFLLGAGLGTAAGFVGLSCASLAGYALGRWAGEPLARRIVGAEELERLRELARRYGDGLLVALRAVPVLAEATTLLGGTARMPFGRFLMLTSMGNAVVAALYAGIGAYSASQSSALVMTAAAMALPLLIVVIFRLATRKVTAPTNKG